MNLHTHTTRCHHATGSEREYIERAIAGGLSVLGFSDHVPMPFSNGRQSGFRIQIEELEDYVRTLEQLREEYRDRIQLLIGFEAEYYPAHFHDMMALLSKYDYDYLIMGQHFLFNEVEGFSSTRLTDDVTLLKQYVDQVLEGLQTGVFTYLAHPDVFHFDYERDPSSYDTHVRRLCRACREWDIPLELNLLGLRGGRHYPNETFFRIVAQEHNAVVIGCDAHAPIDVANPAQIEQAQAYAARLGLSVASHVPLRRPRLN